MGYEIVEVGVDRWGVVGWTKVVCMERSSRDSKDKSSFRNLLASFLTELQLLLPKRNPSTLRLDFMVGLWSDFERG